MYSETGQIEKSAPFVVGKEMRTEKAVRPFGIRPLFDLYAVEDFVAVLAFRITGNKYG